MKKNLLFILCDELRTDALSIYGTPFPQLITPAIDSIGQRGVTFENCYCNSPVCVPSRTSMWTGLYPEQTGVTGNEGYFPPFHFREDFLTLPAVMEDMGYRCASFGKGHVPSPIRMFSYENEEGGELTWGERIRDTEGCIQPQGAPTMIGGLYREGAENYPPQKVTDNALDFLDNCPTDQPFFVRVSYLQPHTPVIPPIEYYQMYQDVPFTADAPIYEGVSGYETRFRHIVDISNLSDEDIIMTKRAYYALVRWVDGQVARLLAKLREKGLDKNTVVVFTADHGAALAENRCYSKQTYAPWVHRVPLLIYDPSDPRGTRESGCCESIDLPKTILSLLGLSACSQFGGRDLFHSKAGYVYSTIGYGKRDSIAYPYVGVGRWDETHGWPMRSCVRKGTYRLDVNVRLNGETDLSPAQRDAFFCDSALCPLENENMISHPAYQDVVEDLRRHLYEHVGLPL